MHSSFNNMKPGFKAEGGLGIQDSKVYVGFIQNNVDVQRMGRLEVFIPELGTDINDPSQWYIVGYASPFAGATDPNKLVKGSHEMDGSQKSYGFWMIPPDINNQVLVIFINGEPTKGVWFACLYQQNMNHMVPGIASNLSFQPGDNGVLPPVVEYNKADEGVSAESPIRPRFNPLHDGLHDEGLYTDFERGPSSSSARRESPSKVFGFNTPRSNSIYIDDNTENEYIRMRTRGGTQILIHETNGYVYINSASGNSWVEVSDDGIDMFSEGNVSIRTKQDLNVRADKNINLDAGLNINLTAGININSGAGQDINEKSGGFIRNTTGTHDTKAPKINRDGLIDDNNGLSSSAKKPKTVARADVPGGTIDTTNSRMPTHEPFALHPKSKGLKPPRGDVPGESQAALPAGSGGAMGSGAGPSIQNRTTNAPPVKTQVTGDGKENKVEIDPEAKAKMIKVGSSKASERVIAAIKRASDMTGVDYGYLMAMAEKESGFNPNAKSTTSSASGLFQFTDSTWNSVIAKYPQYGVGPNDRMDPEKNALMAAVLTKENTKSLQTYGISNPSSSDLYLAHFAGPSTAAKLLKAPPGTPAVDIVGQKVANANPSIFYSNGSPKTTGQVTGNFSNFIAPRAIAYANISTGSTGS